MDEAVFRMGVTCLRNAGIPFWVDYGTLLGMVRDGRLIPWDEDFDLGLWSPQAPEQVVLNALEAGGFRTHSLFARGTTTIHAWPRSGQNGKLDLTFYSRQADRAVHYARAPRNDAWTRLLNSMERFVDPAVQADNRLKGAIEDLYFHTLRPLTPGALKRQLGRGFKALVARNCARGTCYVYDFPAYHFENLNRTSFLDVDVDIPQQVELYLEAAYGADWETPREFANWYDGATRIDSSARSSFAASRLEQAMTP